MLPLSISIGLAVVFFVAVSLLRPKPSHRILPPGPKKSPFFVHLLIGNFFSFPRSRLHEAFASWAQAYGDVVSVKFLQTNIFIISNREKAADLLDRRGNIHSRRPRSVWSEIIGWAGWASLSLQPGKAHSEQRNLLLKGVGLNVAPSYDSVVQSVAHKYLLPSLKNLSGDPASIIEHTVAAVLVTVAYGDALSEEQKQALFRANKEALAVWFSAERPLLKLLLDLVPCLRHIPRWLPGTGFKKEAAKVHKMVDHIRFASWKVVLDDMRGGAKHDSLATKLIESNGPVDAVRDAVAFIYAAGAETTTTAILSTIYALLLHPEVQAKVHAELDETLGEASPTAEDRHRLPYLEAVWKEALRWHPPVPLNPAHESSEDDIWEGYLIPKGSTIFVNIWFLLHDPRIWSEPNVFKPERFLAPVQEGTFDPQSVIYGFGRRICPGRFLNDRKGFSIVASILWAFKIEQAQGTERLDPANPAFVDALVSRPMPFTCKFVPRNNKAVKNHE